MAAVGFLKRLLPATKLHNVTFQKAVILISAVRNQPVIFFMLRCITFVFTTALLDKVRNLEVLRRIFGPKEDEITG
jgi:hypothetical protein